MQWSKIYDNLIDRANKENRVRTKDTYYEQHHIIPKHAGGNNESSNLVLLTFREHILAHYLLWRVYKMEGDRLMYLMRSNQKEEAQKVRVKLAVESNRTGGKGFTNWSGDKHPMKNAEKAKSAVDKKRAKYGKSLRSEESYPKEKRCEVAKKTANRPEVKEKRANTIRLLNSTLTREEKLKKYPRQKEKNANWGRIKGYYIVIDPTGLETVYSSQDEIINRLNVNQSFLCRNRNKGVLYTKEKKNAGKWNGWEFKYFLNPHPKTGKIEKKHKTHKK